MNRFRHQQGDPDIDKVSVFLFHIQNKKVSVFNKKNSLNIILAYIYDAYNNFYIILILGKLVRIEID